MKRTRNNSLDSSDLRNFKNLLFKYLEQSCTHGLINRVSRLSWNVGLKKRCLHTTYSSRTKSMLTNLWQKPSKSTKGHCVMLLLFYRSMFFRWKQKIKIRRIKLTDFYELLIFFIFLYVLNIPGNTISWAISNQLTKLLLTLLTTIT